MCWFGEQQSRLSVERLFTALFLAVLLGACATTPLGRSDLLGFIRDGQTTREETYLHLGEPTAFYEGGRIMSFRLGEDGGGYFLLAKSPGFSGVRSSLILVFDESGVLKRHALVQVKAP